MFCHLRIRFCETCVTNACATSLPQHKKDDKRKKERTKLQKKINIQKKKKKKQQQKKKKKKKKKKPHHVKCEYEVSLPISIIIIKLKY